VRISKNKITKIDFILSIKSNCLDDRVKRYGLYENLGEIHFIESKFGDINFDYKVYYDKYFYSLRRVDWLAQPAFKLINTLKSIYFSLLIVFIKFKGYTIVYGTDRFWALFGEALASFILKNKESHFIYVGMLLAGNIDDIESKRNYFLSHRLKRINYIYNFVGNPSKIRIPGLSYVRSIRLELLNYIDAESISEIVILGEAWATNGLPGYQSIHKSETIDRITKLKNLFPRSNILYKPHPRAFDENPYFFGIDVITDIKFQSAERMAIAGSVSTLLIETAELGIPIILFPSKIPVVAKVQELIFTKIPIHFRPFVTKAIEEYNEVYN
jgi:hypothetical protein